jgi:hypothetical protein
MLATCGFDGQCWRNTFEHLPPWMKLLCGGSCAVCVLCVVGALLIRGIPMPPRIQPPRVKPPGYPVPPPWVVDVCSGRCLAACEYLLPIDSVYWYDYTICYTSCMCLCIAYNGNI